MSENEDRTFHNDTKANYPLPNDEREGHRLDLQHRFIKDVQGGLYPPTLDAKIKQSARILDIGCGNGTWALEVARLLTSDEVIGLDISPVKPIENSPSNLTFVVMNAEGKLPFEDDSFDLVNIRIVPDLSLSANTYPEVARILRPGGVFNSVVLGTYWSPDNTYGPGLRTHTQTLGEIFKRGDSRVSGSKVAELLRDTALFRDVCDVGHDIPVGPWMGDEFLDRIGRDQQENVCEVIDAFKPAMRRGGIPAEKVDQLSKDAQNEVLDHTRHVFWRYHAVYGIKL